MQPRAMYSDNTQATPVAEIPEGIQSLHPALGSPRKSAHKERWPSARTALELVQNVNQTAAGGTHEPQHPSTPQHQTIHFLTGIASCAGCGACWLDTGQHYACPEQTAQEPDRCATLPVDAGQLDRMVLQFLVNTLVTPDILNIQTELLAEDSAQEAKVAHAQDQLESGSNRNREHECIVGNAQREKGSPSLCADKQRDS